MFFLIIDTMKSHVPESLTTFQLGFLMQLMCNYATFVPRKYGAFKNKMSHKKFTSCMIVTYYLQERSY